MGKKSAQSAYGDEGLKSLQKRVDEINKSLGSGNKAIVQTEVDQNNRIKSATITYKNAAGEMIKERMKWQTFINRVMVENPDTGQKEMQRQKWSIFKTDGKTVTDNIEQAKKSLQDFIDTTKKGIDNVDLKKVGFFDQNKLNQAKTMYQQVQNELENIQKTNGRLSDDEQRQFKERIDGIQRTIAEFKKLEDEQNRLNRLGLKGNSQKVTGFNFSGNQESIRNQVMSQLSGSQLIGKRSVKADSLAITSNVIDPKTQQQLIKFTADVETGKNTFSRYKGSIDEATGELRILGETLKSTANRNLDFRQKFAKAMESIPIWMAGMTAFYQTLHFFTDGVAYVNEFNKSLTQLSIVYGESQTQLGGLSKQLRDMAMDMGIATDEVAKGAVEFARQGLTQAEMVDKMQTAIKYAKISNLDFNESAEILTATVNSMGVTAEHAADVFSYMGDATATGSDELGRAMQRVGGTAGALGISLEKVSSWIAIVSSKTRESAETIGNSIKTILARVQNLKEGGFDETDGTKINDVAKALSTVGISLVNADNTFRNFGDVMDELGAKWNTLDSRTQAYIATTVAGTYQQSRFLNLMQGYPQTIDLYSESLNKAGTAQRKFDLYQQGTEAKLQKLKNAWTGIFQDTFQDQGIQDAIVDLTSLVSVIGKAVDFTGGLPVVLGIATTAVLVFSKAVRTVYMDIGKSFISWMKLSDTNLRKLTVSTRTTANAILGAGKSANAATWAVRGLAIGLRGLLTAFLPMLALTAVVTIFQKIGDAMAKAKERAEELKKRNETIVESWTTHRETVEKLIKTYGELEDKTNGGKTFADDEQQQKYNQTVSDLAELLPNLVESINEKGEAHLKSKKAIDEERQSMDALVEAERNYRIETSKKEIGDMFQDIADARKKLAKSQQIANAKPYDFSGDPRKFNPTDPNRSDPERIAQYKVQVIVDQSSLADSINSVKDRFKQLVDDLDKSSDTQLGDALLKTVKGMVDKIDYSTEATANAGMARISSLIEQIQTFKKEMADDSFSRNGAVIQTALAGIKTLAHDLGVEDVDSFANSLLGLGGTATEASHNFKDFKTITDELISSYKDSADSLSDLNGLLHDYANNKTVSAQAAADLIAKDASLVDMFKIEHGQIKINVEAVKDKRDAELDAFDKIARARKEDLINSNQTLVAMLNMYGIQIHAIQTVADAEAAKNKVSEQTAKQLSTYSSLGADYVQQVTGEAANLDGFIDQIGELSQSATVLQKSLGSVGVDTTKPKKDKKDKTKKDIEAFDKLAEQYNRNLANIDKQIQSSEAALAGYVPTSQKYRNALTKEIGLLHDRQDLMHTEADRLRGLRDGYQKQLSAMGSFNKLSDEGKDKYNTLSQKIAELSDTIDGLGSSWLDTQGEINSKGLELSSSSIEQYNTRLTELQGSLALIQNKMSTYPEDSRQYREALISQIDIYKKMQKAVHDEAEEVRKQLKNTKLKDKDRKDLEDQLKGLSNQWWELAGSIASVNDALKDQVKQVADDVVQALKDAYEQQKQIVLDGIDAQIDAINKLHDAQMESLDKQSDAYEKLVNQKKASLQADQDARKYNQDLEKAQTNRQDLQNAINVAELDKTAAGQKKLAELKKQLADADLDIQNMQYDHSIELQQQSLDDQLDAEKERIQNLKDNAEYEITIKGKTEKRKYDIAIQELNDEKEAQTKYYDNIINDDRKWNTVREQIMSGHFENVQLMFSGFESFMKDHSETIAGYLQTNLIDKFADLKKEMEVINPTAVKTMNDLEQMKKNAEAWKNTTDKAKQSQLAAANQAIGKANGWYYDAGSGAWYTDSSKKTKLFHEGGVVGSGGAVNRTTSLVDKLMNTKPNEQVVKALEGELFSPADNIVNNFIPNMKSFAKSLQRPVVTSGNGDIIYNIDVNIEKVVGDKNAGKAVTSEIVNGVKKLGGKI
jgi:TP901 family phage tail tape measure protein